MFKINTDKFYDGIRNQQLEVIVESDSFEDLLSKLRELFDKNVFRAMITWNDKVTFTVDAYGENYSETHIVRMYNGRMQL